MLISMDFMSHWCAAGVKLAGAEKLQLAVQGFH
jgi:hypothetical protein